MNVSRTMSTLLGGTAALMVTWTAAADDVDREKLLAALDDLSATAGEPAPVAAAPAPHPVAAAPAEPRLPASPNLPRVDLDAPEAQEATEKVVVASAAVPAATAAVKTAIATTPASVAPAGTPIGALKERAIETTPGFGWAAVGSALVVLLGVATWLKRRAAKGVVPSGLRIETIATTRIQGKHAVSLVRVGGRVLVVGQGDKGLTLLTELEEEDLPSAAVALTLPRTSAVDTGAGSFVERVNRMRAGWKGGETAPAQKAGARGQTRLGADPFHAAMLEDAPVDELQRLDERAQIRERLEQLRRRAVAVA